MHQALFCATWGMGAPMKFRVTRLKREILAHMLQKLFLRTQNT